MKNIFLLSLIFVVSLSADPGIRDAKDYQNNSTLQWKWAMESLENFPLEATDKVLDVGCGNGAVTAVIAEKAAIVIGLDISNQMLDFAKETYSANNIIYIQGDARALPFVEQFDKATAMLAMNWVKEQDQALSSLYKALKPGGKAIITRPGKKPTNLGLIAEQLIKTERWAPLFPDFKQTKHYYSADEYTRALETAGFTIDSISEDATYTYFKDRDTLKGFYRPLCNFMTHLSDHEQALFLEDIVDLVPTYEPPFADGSIHLFDLKLEVIVRKRSGSSLSSMSSITLKIPKKLR